MPPKPKAAQGDIGQGGIIASIGTTPSGGPDFAGAGADPGSGPQLPAASISPSRSAGAGRPARRLLDLGILNFLLILIGTSSLVAGTWNARRHVEIAELRGSRDRMERERVDIEKAIRDERRWYEGIETDPLLRRELLERLLGPSPTEGIPLDEWLRGAGSTPQA